jgi:predicted ATPase/serine/threonine protein kinase
VDPERWQQIEQLYHAALEQVVTRRAAFVQRACAGDDALRREVESLLAQVEGGNSFLEAPALEMAAKHLAHDQASAADTTPGADSMIGRLITHYRIVSKLGGGGMGVVYKAGDTRLHRFVALKFLPEELAGDPQALSRFEREARAASALNHPNIVTIYELGQVDSTQYIAMEFVEGKTLRELLASGPLPIPKVIQIAAQVAEGLAKAHEAGIIHRDLKPGNLMITRDGLVKILDFGLAKSTVGVGFVPALETQHGSQGATLQEMPTPADPQSHPGLILGTVGYMSPEQACGRTLDFRSDQFSFGVVLYEALTGKQAYQRRTEAETLVALLREEPEPIAIRNPEAPAPLCWAVERCLAKDAGKRYPSTRDLARDLAAIRDRLSEPLPERIEAHASNLPVQRTALIGREREVALAKGLLLRKDVRLVTVTGPGGIGKTRLALQVAQEISESFPGGVYLVSLGAVGDAGLIAAVIAQTLGVREAAGQPLLENLQQHLRNSMSGPFLLLLDNFEHLIAAAPFVSELLAAVPGLKVLATSRAALHVYGEHEFPVGPLALPDPRSLPSLDALVQYPGIALLIQRARAVKPDFEITRENAAAVLEVCARLDGLPLAIELAAARLKFLSPSAIRTRLASRLRLLTGGARDLPVRQQTLRGAIDWSYDLLNTAEQKLFRRLSVFVAGCTLEAAEAVCDTKSDLGMDLLEGMASLVDKSLVQQVGEGEGESRFVMLETIREYGLERLAASGEEGLTKRSHAAYFLVLAEEGAAEVSDADRPGWLNRLEIEHDNLRAALDYLTESGNAEWGLRLGAALFRFWEAREYFAEGRDRLQRMLNLAGAAAPTRARARVAFAAGVLAAEQGDYASSRALHEESLEIARKLADKQGIAVSLNALAVIIRDWGDIAAARSLFEESLLVWRELGNPLDIARSLSNLASVVKLQGDFGRARALYEECLVIFRKLGDRTGAAWSLNHQGDVAREQGDSAAARAFYEQGLENFRELGDQWGIASSLADLGNLARGQRDYHTAHSQYKESLRTFRQLDHKRGIARLLECFACLAAAQSLADQSLSLAGTAAALRLTLGAPLTPAEQAELQRSLEPARRALTLTAGSSTWLEGWAMPLERAIDEALKPDPSCPWCQQAGTTAGPQ